MDNKVYRLRVDDAVTGRGGGGHGKAHQLSIGKGILLGLAADRVAPVHPCGDVFGEERGAVVVIPRIHWLDARIRLQRQGASYIRERIVRRPGYTVVVRFTRVHLVAGGVGARGLTTGCYSRCLVVPHSEERACITDRQVRLPLRLGSVSITVQLEWRAKGHAAIGRADVEDVAGIVVAGVGGGINVANYVVVGRRLTPAHVSPVGGVIVHAGEVARISAVRTLEGRPCVSVGPGVTAVGGSVDEVVAGEVAVATILVHGGDVHVAGNLVGSDLNVADETGVDRYRAVPGIPVIAGIGNE